MQDKRQRMLRVERNSQAGTNSFAAAGLELVKVFVASCKHPSQELETLFPGSIINITARTKREEEEHTE